MAAMTRALESDGHAPTNKLRPPVCRGTQFQEGAAQVRAQLLLISVRNEASIFRMPSDSLHRILLSSVVSVA